MRVPHERDAFEELSRVKQKVRLRIGGNLPPRCKEERDVREETKEEKGPTINPTG
jgi:hypothetical protein